MLFFNKKADNTIYNNYYRQIFTCAELTQLRQISKILTDQEQSFGVLDLQQREVADNAILLPTKLTTSRLDGLLIPILNYIKRKYKQDFELISDGFESKYNTENSKGSNELKSVNIVTKISRLCPAKVSNYKVSQDESVKNVEYTAITDTTNQTAGRNQSHRANGYAYVGIINENVLDYVLDNSYYKFQMENVPDWIAELKVILADVDSWVNSNDCRLKDFKYLCNNFKSKIELIRIHRALTNIKSTAKVEKLLAITHKEVDVLIDVITAVLKLCRSAKEYDEIETTIAPKLLKSVGLTVKRKNSKKMLIIEPESISKLTLLRSEIESTPADY